MAISPAFIFYGRYSIHEVWLLAFLDDLRARVARALELRDARLSLVCGDRHGRDDSDQGDLHHPHRLRADRGRRAVGFASNHPDAECEACAAAVGLRRSRDRDGHGDLFHRLLLLGHLSQLAGRKRTLPDFRDLVSDRVEGQRPRKTVALLA